MNPARGTDRQRGGLTVIAVERLLCRPSSGQVLRIFHSREHVIEQNILQSGRRQDIDHRGRTGKTQLGRQVRKGLIGGCEYGQVGTGRIQGINQPCFGGGCHQSSKTLLLRDLRKGAWRTAAITSTSRKAECCTQRGKPFDPSVHHTLLCIRGLENRR
ncbi:protein of unknown function [Thiomonas sp. Bio17B3]|nr:protein of unknown function [Thiomonas sp. Bio17B3]VDY08706.1 protein of unknown function [Thiomonas sp. Sup16B3]VDY12368.1 protein of unknown function [Thiomonas sp. OC7]